MKTIIAGSRTITDSLQLESALAQCGWVPTLVLCGCAGGVDRLGFDWARANRIRVAFHPAWQQQANWAWGKVRGNETIYWPNPGLPLGKGAGYSRNAQMAKNSEALIALWDGKSRGTGHMIDEANKRGLRVYIHRVE